MKILTVKLEAIRLDGATQTRAAIDMATVESYTAVISAGGVFPPVELVFDGTDHWIVDGYHRVHAFRRAGHTSIPATVVEGTREKAVWDACAANSKCGLTRTNADKRRAVEIALLHPAGATLSDHAIAAHCGVHQTTVGRVRGDLAATNALLQTAERTGKDGRTRNVSKIGRTKKVAAEKAVDAAEEHVEPSIAPKSATTLKLVGPSSTKGKKRGPKPTPADEAEGIRALAAALSNIRTQWRCKSLVWSEGGRRDMVFATRRCNEIVKAIRAVEQVLEEIAKECDASRPALASG